MMKHSQAVDVFLDRVVNEVSALIFVGILHIMKEQD